MAFLSLRLSLVAGLALVSGLSFAAVDEAQLAARLKQLAPLAEQGLDYAALEREASYELQSLPTSERARLEAQLLFSRVQAATVTAYEQALEESHGNADEAVSIVREFVENDLAKVNPTLSASIKAATEQIISNGAQQTEAITEFPANVTDFFTNESKERQELLNQDAFETASRSSNSRLKTATGVNPSSGSGLNAAARGVRSYKTKPEFLKAMVSGDESERWVATANMSIIDGEMSGSDGEISLQVKVDFLGSEISAGPTLRFYYTASTSLDIKGEGIYPIYDGNGLFDLNWKGADGRPLVTNGKTQRRFVFFTCNASIELETKIEGGGSLKIFGMGAEGRSMTAWRKTIEASSRRMLIPDTIDGQQVTVQMLAKICHKDFLNVRTQNGKTARQNLHMTLANMAKSLVYSNPSMQCATDNHCTGWFNKKWRISKMRAVPRCAQSVGNSGLMTCQTRGREGASCPVYLKGKHVSVGVLEHPCDKGFRCVVIQPYVPNIISFLPAVTYGVGECRAVRR